MTDSQYQTLPRPSGGLTHYYGPNVHILSYPWPMSLLARLCAAETVQPQVNHLVGALYEWLLGEVASGFLGVRDVDVPTRMAVHNPEGIYRGQAIDPDQDVVVVDVARAGMLPSQRVFDALHLCMDPRRLRQDHVVASRVADAAGRVTGVRIDSSKIGGPVAGAVVLIPDPMAATGTSLTAVVRRYLDAPEGPPARIVAMHLIATPEYIAHVRRELPAVEIVCVRLDRGLSPPEVLAAAPGLRATQEVGLNDHQYIVPGAGGLGEVINNAWV